MPVVTTSVAGAGNHALRFDVTGNGTYLLTLDGSLNGKCVFRMARSFSVCPDNQPLIKKWAFDQFFIGTCSFPARQSWSNKFGTATCPGLTPAQSADLDAERSARMGLQVVRFDALAGTAGKDDPDGKGWLDAPGTDSCVKALTSRGIKLDLQLWGPAPVLKQYEKATDPLWRYPRLEGPYRAYIREAASRYAKDSAFIEIGNEPDNLDFWHGTPQECIAQHKCAVEEIRKVAPKAVLANGGYCLMKPEWTPILASGFKGTTDLIAYHSHGDLPALKKSFAEISRLHSAAGYASPRYINTEMGWAAWRLDQEQNQATTALQKTLYCWAHGHRGALLYSSRDVGGPRMKTGDEVDWGYSDYFFCPRFAYGALSALINTLAGARFKSIAVETDNLHVYMFDSGGKTVVCAFTVKDEKAVILDTEAEGEKPLLYDAMGNVGPLRLTAGTAVLHVGQYPVIAVFPGGSKVTVRQ